MSFIQSNNLQLLQEWINGAKDFNQGLLLLEAIGKKAQANSIRKTNNAAALFQQLMQAYLALKNKAVEVITVVESVETTTETTLVIPPKITLSKTKKIEQLRTDWRMTLKEIASLRSRLYWIGRHNTGEPKIKMTKQELKERADIINLIIKKDNLSFDLYYAMQHFEAYGELPIKTKLPKTRSIKEMKRMLKNSISKKKKSIENWTEKASKATGAAKFRMEDKIANLKRELKEFEQQLNE